MTPQALAVLGTFISFCAGIAASRGIISKETADYLAGPEALAVVGTVIGAGVAVWGVWRNRPHAIIKDAAALPQVNAVITKPKTAEEIPADNVVSTLAEAARVPGVSAH